MTGIHLIVALVKIIDYGVDRLIYVSCKPTSLVRDLEVFLEKGYQVDRAVAVDQFPWTANCETIALLSKKQQEEKSGEEDKGAESAFAYREEEIPECECIYG